MIENIIIIICVNLLFFWRTLHYNYCSDDVPTYRATKDHYKDCWWKRLFWEIEGTVKVSQKRDHAITLALHTLVCIFIYIGFGATTTSLIAAFLFMVNPSNNQGSIWISGRGYVLPTLFLLMAISIPYLAPALLLLVTYFHTGFFTPLLFTFSPYTWFLLTIPIIWLFWFKRFRVLVKRKVEKEMFGEDKKVHPKKFILFFKTFGFYLSLAVIPFRTTFYHAYMQSMAGNEMMKRKAYKIDHFFYIGVSALTIMVWYIFKDPTSRISMAIAWWIVGIAPYCNLVRFHQEIAERYCYLPMVGLMYVLAHFILNYVGKL